MLLRLSFKIKRIYKYSFILNYKNYFSFIIYDYKYFLFEATKIIETQNFRKRYLIIKSILKSARSPVRIL